VHQRFEHGSVFKDPLAIRILGDGGEEAMRRATENPARRRLRLFIAMRTRFAEDAMGAAIAGGVRQVVILGAGLDTYAYRSAPVTGLRIFEVDHPATQAWKRRCLDNAGITIPARLTFAPVDLQCETLDRGLESTDFDRLQPAIFSWLGVVPYLTRDAVFATLGEIASLPGGAVVVFDYSNPLAEQASDPRACEREALAARVAGLGEPFRSYFQTESLRRRLSGLGFSHVEDLGPDQIRARFFAGSAATLSDRGGHVVLAATTSLGSRSAI
jgi:methyltransferase (TIGR00027 family)